MSRNNFFRAPRAGGKNNFPCKLDWLCEQLLWGLQLCSNSLNIFDTFNNFPKLKMTLSNFEAPAASKIFLL
jgi:hypothetical protein